MRKRNFSEDSMRILLASLATIVVEAYADVPVGLIGGETSGSAAYAAFVASDGTLTPISDLPSSANTISSVAMNATGAGLIGGQISGSTGYAALVSPSGGLTPPYAHLVE